MKVSPINLDFSSIQNQKKKKKKKKKSRLPVFEIALEWNTMAFRF